MGWKTTAPLSHSCPAQLGGASTDRAGRNSLPENCRKRKTDPGSSSAKSVQLGVVRCVHSGWRNKPLLPFSLP
ncbi:hypothetical protein ZHAS_00021329 [Anopheles sinensis]|uniref:Uncharacterized protein n=1 Tax=Anopheles sinensis TaxID=74873 RepID=A0A084WS36_ANOSI|nr:hypothetical protein ZHAS_00021329 [Anopheles sinensis]